MRIRLFTIALSLLLLCLFHLVSHGQAIARLTLSSAGNDLSIPVCISLDNISTLPDSAIALREVKGKAYLPVSCQVGGGACRMLWWIAADCRKWQAGNTIQIQDAGIRWNDTCRSG